MSAATTLQIDPGHLVLPESEPPSRWYYASKRLFDLTAAVLALVLLLPLCLVIAFAIRIDSAGPILFTQQRVRSRRVVTGDQTKWVVEEFTLRKFRTMVADTHDERHREYMTAYISGDEEYFALRPGGYEPGESFRLKDDPRVTRVGRLLRRLSLDELPQLLNVVRGQMSIVGPRPPMAYEVALYDDRDLKRLAAPGGITGWAQVNGRCTIDFSEVVRLDCEYVARHSFWFDLRVLLRTVPTVLSRNGAD